MAEAGVAQMTLYNHFPPRETLVESVLEFRYRRYREDLRGPWRRGVRVPRWRHSPSGS